MVEKSVILNDINTAKAFVAAANKAPFEIDVVSGRHKVDGKSILGIFSLDLSKPVSVIVIADAAEAGEFLDDIAPYIANERVDGYAGLY